MKKFLFIMIMAGLIAVTMPNQSYAGPPKPASPLDPKAPADPPKEPAKEDASVALKTYTRVSTPVVASYNKTSTPLKGDYEKIDNTAVKSYKRISDGEAK